MLNATNIRKAFTLFACAFLAACSTATYRIVDNQEKLIQEVLRMQFSRRNSRNSRIFLHQTKHL